MTDTAEYWNDVKGFRGLTTSYTHYKGCDCGHFHSSDTTKLLKVDCHACMKIIESDAELSAKLTNMRKQQKESREASLRINKGYKLKSIIRFGKYKKFKKSIQQIIDNDRRYFDWMISDNVILLHPEVYEYLTNNPVKQ